MKIVLNNLNSQYQENIFFENLDNIDATFKNFSSIKGTLEAKIFEINESISSNQLSHIKKNVEF